MAVLAECDICGNQHRVKDAFIGTAIRCKDCGVQIVVPKDQFITPDKFIEEHGRLRQRDVVPSTSPITWLVAGTVAAVVFGALVVTVWALIALANPQLSLSGFLLGIMQGGIRHE